METVIIPQRFNGPPGSGNGGYVAGRLAAFLPPADNAVWPEVTLRAPIPLETLLRVVREDNGIRILDGEAPVASAREEPGGLDVPPPPDLDQARDGQAAFTCYVDHPLETCFVCGTARPPGDGLRIFTGPFADDGLSGVRGHVAALWEPDASLADQTGLVAPEFLWAALDCPGAFAVEEATPGTGLKVLGRLSARIFTQPVPGETIIVSGWHLDSDGRKHRAGTGLHRPDGTLLACARATWVELRPAA